MPTAARMAAVSSTSRMPTAAASLNHRAGEPRSKREKARRGNGTGAQLDDRLEDGDHTALDHAPHPGAQPAPPQLGLIVAPRHLIEPVEGSSTLAGEVRTMVVPPAAGMSRPRGMPSGVWVPAIWSKAAVNSRSEVKAVPSPNHSAVASSESSSAGGVPRLPPFPLSQAMPSTPYPW